jgi:hypothetical protein
VLPELEYIDVRANDFVGAAANVLGHAEAEDPPGRGQPDLSRPGPDPRLVHFNVSHNPDLTTE